jgi:hypothetical protein
VGEGGISVQGAVSSVQRRGCEDRPDHYGIICSNKFGVVPKASDTSRWGFGRSSNKFVNELYELSDTT